MDQVEELKQDLRVVVRSIRQHLESARRNRTSYPLLSEPAEAKTSAVPKKSVISLHDIREEIGDCRRCPLCEKRTNIVFGEGNPKAELMFVGEGPGADEDVQGRPFVGRAGQLLNRMIMAMGLKRNDVYIANVVKCRPPQNRAPKQIEIETCTQFLQKQIGAVRPKIICALGSVAAQYFMGTEKPISLLRGKLEKLNGSRVISTYHPAYLLRNPEAKKLVWSDMQIIMKALGLTKHAAKK